MAKPIGPVCNLNCAYCFYLNKKDFLHTEDSFHMSNQVLDAFIRQYIESQSVQEVQFVWQGGEPSLMGIAFFKRALDLQEKYRRPGMNVYNAFQTNGTLIDKEWALFFKENNFLVGVSIDGPPELHDLFRRDKHGHPSSHEVCLGLEAMKQCGVEFNLICTVNSVNVRYPRKVYRYLKSLSDGFIQFIPVVEAMPGGGVSERSVSGKAFGSFLCKIFDDWLESDVGKVFVQHFDLALEAWMGLPSSMCVFAQTCGKALIIEHNGDIYSCDHYVFPEYRLGNITKIHLYDLVYSDFQREFGLNKQNSLSTLCRECEVLFACHGECPKNRLSRSPQGEPLNFLCSGYKRFFKHIEKPMKMMTAALRDGHPAREAAASFKSIYQV